MSFLYPAFLYGLFALAIPVIIHLFHFRKAKKVYFSNTRFLQSVKKVSQAKLRFRHLLVLFARLLFILFLVLTFAQPYLPSAAGIRKAGLVDIYLDNSYSLSNRVAEDLSGLDAAVQLAQELVNSYPQGTRFRLLTNDFNTAAQYYTSAETIADRLTEVQFSGVNRSLPEVLNRLEILPMEEENAQREVFILSDFQEHHWFREAEPELDTLTQISLLPIEFEQAGNLHVDTVYLDQPVIFSASDNTIHVVLANEGMKAVEDVPVSLSVSGQQVANSTVSIPAKGQANLSFQLNFPLQPFTPATLSFQDFPLTFDNTFHFVIQQASKVKVLEITDEPGETAISKVYADTSYFLFESSHPGNLNVGAVSSADLVVVNGLSSLGESLGAALRDFESSGGSILFISAEEGMPDAVGLLAGNLALEEVQLPEAVRVSPVPLEHPFFQDIFEETDEPFNMPKARPVVSWQGNSEELLELQSGHPFLSRQKQLYLLASPMEEEFTNFHQHALFVPVMYKVAFNSLQLSNKLYHTTDDNLIRLQLAEAEGDKVYKLKRKEQEIIPNQRLNDRMLQLELPSYVIEPGYYQLLMDDEVVYQLAFNHSKQESKLDQLRIEKIEEEVSEIPQMEVIKDIDLDNIRASVEEKFEGEALWKWTLLLALLALLAEVLLIRFLK
ncbi:BatA domain-containing protein [Nafulsella turpanensis]|uniref:BatA domain-containing protein n=1 Tax=Nafulsella turpanensis TaxID=1265690 RepID=UPI00034D7CF9|nr:BatA domain-containing protein [Nafulsella turpanensis]